MIRTRHLCAGVLLASALGCERWEPAEGTLDSNRQELLQAANSVLWPTGSIPVCFGSNAMNNWTPAIRAGFQDAVVRTWGRFTKIRFTGFAACNSSPTNTIVVDQMFDGGGLTQLDPVQKIAYEWFNIPGSQAVPNENDWNTFVHETGHAIGFAHEQERIDNFDSLGNPIYCNRAEAPAKTDATTLTNYFDPWSMMDYCTFDYTDWSNNGAIKTNTNGLSFGDIRGAQVTYSKSTAANWSDAHMAILGPLF